MCTFWNHSWHYIRGREPHIHWICCTRELATHGIISSLPWVNGDSHCDDKEGKWGIWNLCKPKIGSICLSWLCSCQCRRQTTIFTLNNSSENAMIKLLLPEEISFHYILWDMVGEKPSNYTTTFKKLDS